MENSLTTPKGTIGICPAQTADAAALRVLRLEALASDSVAFAADYAATEAGGDELWVDRITENAVDNRGVIFTASSESRLIGMTGLIRGHWPKTRHSANIWGVYVNAVWRGFHIAEAMIEACIVWAKPQGITVVKLGVVTSNTPAIRCYTRCGFTVYGVEPQANYADGLFYDELLMVRFI